MRTNETNQAYEPEVDDYVIWDKGKHGKDEGWVYFKGDPVDNELPSICIPVPVVKSFA